MNHNKRVKRGDFRSRDHSSNGGGRRGSVFSRLSGSGRERHHNNHGRDNQRRNIGRQRGGFQQRGRGRGRGRGGRPLFQQRKVPLHERLAATWSHDGDLTVALEGRAFMEVTASGKFTFFDSRRDNWVITAINMVLRPFNFKVQPEIEGDPSSAWFFSDNATFYAAVPFGAPFEGPSKPRTDKRLPLLKELLDAQCLFTIDRWSSKKNRTQDEGEEAKMMRRTRNPVVELHALCRDSGWSAPKFKYLSKSAISATDGAQVGVYKCTVRVEGGHGKGFGEYKGEPDEWVMNKVLALHVAADVALEYLKKKKQSISNAHPSHHHKQKNYTSNNHSGMNLHDGGAAPAPSLDAALSSRR